MLNVNGKNIKSMLVNGKMLSALWKNGKLIWQSVRSCFGAGGWNNDMPWDNDDGWCNE